ncbi:MAG: hypothetical protein WBF53_05060 [Litorimonas sp.]
MSTLKDISAQIGLVSGQDFAANQNVVQLDFVEPIALGRVHEATGALRTSHALSLAARLDGRVLWIAIGHRARSLRARGLAAYCAPEHLILIETANRDETLWAGEEALRCRGASLVVIDIDKGPDLFESRRLQIAAQHGGATGLVLIRRQAQSSGCETRWQCDPDPSRQGDWSWSLTRSRRGRPRAWSVRGDPPERIVHPPDLRPASASLHTSSQLAPHALFRLTTHPRPLVSGPAA